MEWCGAVNAMVVKNEKDVKFRPICRKIWLQKNPTFIRIRYLIPFKTSK